MSSRTNVFTNECLHERMSSRTNVFTNECLHERMSSRTNVFTKECLLQHPWTKKAQCLHERMSSRTNVFTNECLHERMSPRTNVYYNTRGRKKLNVFANGASLCSQTISFNPIEWLRIIEELLVSLDKASISKEFHSGGESHVQR